MKNKTKTLALAHPILRILSDLLNYFMTLVVVFYFLNLITKETDIASLLTLLTNIVIFSVVSSFVLFVLVPFVTSKFGGNVGQLLYGIKVVDEKENNLSFQAAFLRNTIGKMVAAFVLGLGYFWVFLNDKKQGWHDMVTNSFVVVENKKYVFLGLFVTFILLVFSAVEVRNIAENINTNRSFYEEIFVEIQNYGSDNNPKPLQEIENL